MVFTEAEVAPQVIGHEWAVDMLRRALAADHLSQSYLFVGPPHVGKTTLALYLASALNCLATVTRPCGVCSACQKTARGAHPDVSVVDEQASSIKIDRIRQMQRELALSPFEGQRRVHIICGFEKATLEAANCLLKTLEEPPPRAVLILTATEAEALLPTIVSRCQVLNLRPLPVARVTEALQTRYGVEPSQAALLARLSEGRIGWAIEASENDVVLRNREKYLLAMEQVPRQDRTERMGLAQQISQSPQSLPEIFDLWQSWWRDLMLAKSGNVEALTNVDRGQTVLVESQHYTMAQIRDCLRAIRRAERQVEQNVSPCLALEVLLLQMPRLPS